MRELKATQQLLWQLITAPEGVQSGIEMLDAAQQERYRGLLRPAPRMSAVERIDVYANMYFFRLLDCLREDYPAVACLLGDDRFHNLVTDYILAHPPRHFSLRHVGDRLSLFVASHTTLAEWPYAADLARFEWGLVDAFDAPDALPIDVAALLAIEAESWPDLCFELTPSLRLIESGWAVHETWESVQNGDALLEAPLCQTQLVVWRQDLRVRYRAIDAAEVVAITKLSCGDTFAVACAAMEASAAPEDAAQIAASKLARWLADGLLVAVR